MDRINDILNNNKFIKYLNKNEKREKRRVFCKHTLEHFLDTARIAYIINLENNLGISKEDIYATALLHDIGKWKQYESGIPHEIASSELAKTILQECSFNATEIGIITEAILGHRKKEENPKDLIGLISLADKLSRNCFNCKAKDNCSWNEEKKNHGINM